ncbi:PA0069 family radical SAM protein [Niveibacterium umoris]|uniref:DNA repair photolyase n=1 Tax=Niveibacterium umoris TaxID=1193620 RepID=A0A840BJ93_9RHOO|nr:PA0069 family radical SAM protein [Niveibacterium umoris]MBB4012434.1 DNA repair photolyase [Niveibacterium umoris]
MTDRKLDPFVQPLSGFRGRGAATRPDGRFESMTREAFDDGWTQPERDAAPPTELIVDTAKSVIVESKSPDIPFERSINPYRGCEHGCSYCFARPTHSYLGFSPGIDFETRILWKPDAPAVLKRELARHSYRCRPIALGINTDGWQPVERKLGLTRKLLEVLCECRHPVSIVTKSALIERDLDLLADMARDDLVQVMFSVTTLDRTLARAMEPRAAAPERRLAAMRALHQAGVPVGVLFAPLIPALNDHELEAVLHASQESGADTAGYVLLRLPHELKDLFPDWLERHVPGRAKHVLSVLRQMHDGALYDSRFGQRMRGNGVFADLYAARFLRASERLGLNRQRKPLNTLAFKPPRDNPAQQDLFD